MSAAQRGMLHMSVFAILWVVLEYGIGGLLSQRFPIIQIIWWRYVVHVALVLLLSATTRPRVWRTRRLGFHWMRSLAMLVMPLCYAGALSLGAGEGTVWTLFWLAPLFGLGTAYVLLGEKADRIVWATSGLAWICAGLMMARRDHPSASAVILALGMSLSFAVYFVMTRQLRTEPVMTNLLYTALGVIVMLTPVLRWYWVTPSVRDALLLSAIGAVGLVALYALDHAASHSSIAEALPMLFTYLPAMTLLLWIGYGVRPTHRAGIGAVAIGAMLVHHWYARKRANPQALVAAA